MCERWEGGEEEEEDEVRFAQKSEANGVLVSL